jgi:hypothetical protein
MQSLYISSCLPKVSVTAEEQEQNSKEQADNQSMAKPQKPIILNA